MNGIAPDLPLQVTDGLGRDFKNGLSGPYEPDTPLEEIRRRIGQ
jgi:hypothetical protein